MKIDPSLLYSGLSSKALHLYLIILDKQEYNKLEGLTQHELGNLLGISDNTVRTATRELLNKSLIQSVRLSKKPNTYTLVDSKAEGFNAFMLMVKKAKEFIRRDKGDKE